MIIYNTHVSLRRDDEKRVLVSQAIGILQCLGDLLHGTSLTPWPTNDVAFTCGSVMQFLANCIKTKAYGLGTGRKSHRLQFLWSEVKQLSLNSRLLKNAVCMLQCDPAPRALLESCAVSTQPLTQPSEGNGALSTQLSAMTLRAESAETRYKQLKALLVRASVSWLWTRHKSHNRPCRLFCSHNNRRNRRRSKARSLPRSLMSNAAGPSRESETRARAPA